MTPCDRNAVLHRMLLNSRYPVPLSRIMEALDCCESTARRAIRQLRNAQRAPRTLSPLPPGAPSSLTLTRGPVSGSVIVRASRVPEAGSYDLQITAGDPTVEGNWTDAGVYKNCRRIELQGLTLYKTYSVRMRALGAAGYGEWSTPTSVVVM